MEWIIVLVIALFLFSKNGGSLNLQASTTPVGLNATGGSLSGALGNSAQPPSYYVSGNPGYSNTSATPNPPAGVSSPTGTAPVTIPSSPTSPPALGPVRQRIGVSNIVPVFPSVGPVKVSDTPQPKIIPITTVSARQGPENAAPVWTKAAPVRIAYRTSQIISQDYIK